MSKRTVVIAWCVLGCASLAHGQATAERSSDSGYGTPDIAVGPSGLLLLGPVSGIVSLAIDATVDGPVAHAWFWTAGARLGLSPVAPEVFGRLSARPRFGTWTPSAGLEVGVTVRGLEDQGDRLLMELRSVSQRELSPLYVAIHSAPLRFRLSEQWRLSCLELSVGTHLAPIGRYVRVNLLLASIGVAL